MRPLVDVLLSAMTVKCFCRDYSCYVQRLMYHCSIKALDFCLISIRLSVSPEIWPGWGEVKVARGNYVRLHMGKCLPPAAGANPHAPYAGACDITLPPPTTRLDSCNSEDILDSDFDQTAQNPHRWRLTHTRHRATARHGAALALPRSQAKGQQACRIHSSAQTTY